MHSLRPLSSGRDKFELTNTLTWHRPEPRRRAPRPAGIQPGPNPSVAQGGHRHDQLAINASASSSLASDGGDYCSEPVRVLTDFSGQRRQMNAGGCSAAMDS